MTKWTRLKDRLPEAGGPIVAFDVLLGDIHLAFYGPGMTDDSGNPCLESLSHKGDDYDLQYWMPAPSAPNVEEAA